MARLLDIQGLSVRFDTPEGAIAAVSDVDFSVETGECVGVVGESGSGKSQIFLALLGLLTRNGRATGHARLGDIELLGRDEALLNQVRGARIGMIFQDPMTSLTPHLTIGEQLTETLEVHRGLTRAAARARAVKMLERVRIGDSQTRLNQYPHELSGGMRQRAMIAIALLCDPELVIADEPTTALDVTIQAQILALFRELRVELHMTLVLITHDLAVAAGLCDRIAVMYAGRIVEQATTREIFRAPRHPYTEGLLAAAPRLDDALSGPMRTIAGQPPTSNVDVAGCSFADRCPRVSDRCRKERPQLLPDAHADGNADGRVACHHPLTDPRP
jgi:oligopeptide transport system ATP-binding protein